MFSDQPADAVTEPPTEEERLWAVAMHLGYPLTYLTVGAAVLLGPIVWLVKKDGSPYLDRHGRQVTNFLINGIVWNIAGLAVGFLTCGVGFVVAVPVLLVVGVVGTVLAVIGAIKAGGGEDYRYPLCLPFLN